MAKEAFNKRRSLLTSRLNTEMKKKLVRCYIWSIALYGSETWTLRKLEKKYLESFEMWCWRKMEKIKWTEKVSDEEVLKRVSEERMILNNIVRRKANWIGHILRRNGILHDVIEGKIEGKRGPGRTQFMDDLKNGRRYGKLKEEAQDRDKWRKQFHQNQT